MRRRHIGSVYVIVYMLPCIAKLRISTYADSISYVNPASVIVLRVPSML